MIPQGHAVITDIRVDQSLIGKLLNKVEYVLITGNGETRQDQIHIQPFEFEVFTGRQFSLESQDELREAYTEDLTKRLDAIKGRSKKERETVSVLEQVRETIEDRVRLFETKSHKIGIIAPTYSFDPITKVIGSNSLIPKTTQVRNLFGAPFLLGNFDGNILLPTSTPLDLTKLDDELLMFDIETTNYDLRELTEREMHSTVDQLVALYEQECKTHKKRMKKNLHKKELIREIHLLRNDGKKKRLSGSMLATTNQSYIISELELPQLSGAIQTITSTQPAKETISRMMQERKLFIAHHYGLSFDNPEFDELAKTKSVRFTHNTKGGSVSVYARRSNIDIDTFGARHLPGLVNGKLATLYSAYTGNKATKPLTHAELEQNIQAAMLGDEQARRRVLDYMEFDITTQKTLTQIVARPLLHLAYIFQTTTASVASSDPSTIIKSYIERKFERLNDTTFFPKYMWALKRELEKTDLKKSWQKSLDQIIHYNPDYMKEHLFGVIHKLEQLQNK